MKGMGKQWRVAKLLLALLLAGCYAVGKDGTPDIARGPSFRDVVFVELTSNWQHAPPEAEIDEATAGGRGFMLAGDGNVAIVDCTFRKYRGAVSISPGDGEVVYLGHWKADSNGGADLSYFKVSETVPAYDNTDQPFSKKLVSKLKVSGHAVTLDGHPALPNLIASGHFKSEYLTNLLAVYGRRLDEAFRAN